MLTVSADLYREKNSSVLEEEKKKKFPKSSLYLKLIHTNLRRIHFVRGKKIGENLPKTL